MSSGRPVVASAPARANLLGNPSDLYGGAVLACSLPLRVHVEVAPGDAFEVVSGEERLRISEPADLALRGDVFDVARAAWAADREWRRHGGDADSAEGFPPVRIRYTSEIPFGSGLGGSSALLVALLYALAAWRGERLSPYVLAERSRAAERRWLGVACGWVDHYLCSFGGLRFVDLRGKLDGDTPHRAPYAAVEDLSGHVPHLPFVLAFTGVAHHSGSVHTPIRARWERGEPAVVAAYERMTALAREGKRALLHADWQQLGALLDENHALTRELGGSGDANERLIATARDAGALGAKLAGAGGGGTIVALWPDPDARPLESALRAAGATALYRPAVTGGFVHYETLLTERQDGVLTVTLHRPDRLNAFTPQMMEELLALFDVVDADDDVRAVVVTGAGRGFCAGADLGSGGDTFDSSRHESAEVHRDGGGRVSLRIFECRKPVIAAINGPAVGVGATMTLPMDIRIASAEARFGFVFCRRGIVPEAASSWFLPRIVGISQAMEWVATGRVFSAEEALAGRLVSRVVPGSELLSVAHGLAREIAEHTSAVSVALARQMLWRMLGADHPMEAHRIDSQAIFAMGRSPDAYEGVQSFLEKRPPRFSMAVSTDLPAFVPWWRDRPFRE